MNHLDFDKNGICIFDSFLSKKQVNEAIFNLKKTTTFCQKLQEQNSLEKITLGSTHHLPAIEEFFLELLNEYKKIDDFIFSIFGGKYILNSFGGNLNFPNKQNYASNIHKDQRFFSGDKLLILNTFIPLCDFNEENGATRILTKDVYYSKQKPNLEFFIKNSLSINIKAGSLCIFNSNLWHSAGKNNSAKERPIITPMFSRPFMKQQYDYPSLVNTNQNLYLKQLLGFYSRVPKNLSEWYSKPDERCYLKDQDYDL